MIEFTDRTLIESQGSYPVTCEIMNQDVDWMLISDAYVYTDLVTAKYILHLWKNGDIIIFDTEHPANIEIPDSDLRELKNWCTNNGWKRLIVDTRLMMDARGFEFWMRLYRAGIIYADVLKEHEDDEIRRFAFAYANIEDKDGD